MNKKLILILLVYISRTCAMNDDVTIAEPFDEDEDTQQIGNSSLPPEINTALQQSDLSVINNFIRNNLNGFGNILLNELIKYSLLTPIKELIDYDVPILDENITYAALIVGEYKKNILILETNKKNQLDPEKWKNDFQHINNKYNLALETFWYLKKVKEEKELHEKRQKLKIINDFISGNQIKEMENFIMENPFLLNSQDENKRTPLIMAVFHENVGAVKAILQYLCQPNADITAAQALTKVLSKEKNSQALKDILKLLNETDKSGCCVIL